jgi:hypothetical protein
MHEKILQAHAARPRHRTCGISLKTEIDKFTVSNIKQELTEDKRKKRRLRNAEVEPTAWL